MAKVFGFSKKSWSLIFFCVNALNVAFMILVMVYDSWFYQVWVSKSGSFTFQGKLLGPRNDDLKTICTSSETYYDCSYYCAGDGCQVFLYWFAAAVVYIFFQMIAIFLSVLNMIVLLSYRLKPSCCRNIFSIYTTSILMFFVVGFHFMGLSIWLIVMKFQFNSCEHTFPYSYTESVCGENGPYLAAGTLGWLLIISISYHCIVKRGKMRN